MEFRRAYGGDLGPLQHASNLHKGTARLRYLLRWHPRLNELSTDSGLVAHSQPKGQIPDYEEPVILHATNPTIEEFCNRLHRGLLAEFSHAWVCKCPLPTTTLFSSVTKAHVSNLFHDELYLAGGKSAKHQPQRCGKDHVLCDEDIVQICKKV